MPDDVKARRYHAPQRAERAAATRRSVLEAARLLFTTRGYPGTTVTEIARRAANMRLFAADLRATGELRPDLTDEEVADIVWATNSADYYALLVDGRGWSPERYGRHLADAWRRMLLEPR